MTPPLPALAFLGAGSMGGAILRGVLASGIPRGPILATNRSAQKAAGFAGLEGVESIALSERPEGNADAASAARIVLLGVKPGAVVDLLAQIAPVLREDAIVVSLAGGVPLARMSAVLPEWTSVVRAMPNTPSTVGKGVTALAAASATSREDRALVRAVFESVGVVIEVDEEQIDAVGTISGSGPAYVYLLIEEFARAAVAKGFRQEDARLMTEQTFIGAARLLEATGEDPAELRRQVTSPQGSTERAIAVLAEAGLEALFTEATDAALARARELSAEA